jgi:hypothetical protein
LRASLLSRVYAVLAKVSSGYPPLKGRFLRVTHPSAARRQCVLLRITLPLDLHVLSVPPAFNLSHDQTLHFLILSANINSYVNASLTLTAQVSAHIYHSSSC